MTLAGSDLTLGQTSHNIRCINACGDRVRVMRAIIWWRVPSRLSRSC